MTTYYVRKTGNDGSAGTSPATAWLTIGKALGAAGISSGDTVYIGAGVYREKVTCNLISPVAETFIIGDCDGSHTGDAGEIRLTNYLTDDKTAPTEQGLLDLNGCDYLTFENITFHFACTTGISAISANTALATSQYIVFRNCYFNLMDTAETGFFLSFANNGALPFHVLIDKCIFWSADGGAIIYILHNVAPVIEYDMDFVVQNSFFMGADLQAALDTDGGVSADTGYGGGIIMRNCTCIGDLDLLFTNRDISTTFPCIVSGCFVATDWHVPIETTSSAAGQILEDYNILFSKKPPSSDGSVVSGGHSIIGIQYAALLHFGQELQQGLSLRPLGMPTVDSPLLGFGDDGNAPSVDILNRPRPAGGQSILKAVGAYERHDTAVKETTVFDVTPGIKIVGPGDHEFQIPVDATATTISVKARYDANHAATNKPQAILLAAPEIGVTAETKTMTAAVNTWETLTFTQFTPTASGVVVVRLVSRSAADNGIAYFDTFNIS